MSAIMFETTVTAERQLHGELPLSLPIGSRVRVTVEEVVNSSRSQATGQDIKNLLAAMPDVGEDADFARPSAAASCCCPSARPSVRPSANTS